MMYIEIEGNDRSNKIRQRDINVPDQLNERSQVFLTMRGSSSIRPAIGNDVIFYDSDSKTNKKYAGVIESITEREYGPYLQWDIDVVGYESILDRFVVPESYVGQTCKYIIEDVISQFVPSAEGISTGNVETGPTIEKAVFGYDWTVAKVLKKLSEITGYFWYVDYDKDVHFEERTTNTAPFDITDSTDLYDFEVENLREEYRNQQYIRAGKGTSEEVTDSFAGDGETRNFQFRAPLAEEPVIEINGTAISASEIGIGDVEENKKWYWNKGETTVYQADTETVLTETDKLEITGKYLYPIRVFAQLGAEIDDRATAEGNSGKYAHVASRANINDSAAAQQEAEGLLAKYGEIPEKIHYFTFEDGLQAGQLQTITRSNHDIDGEYLISKVTLRPYGYKDGVKFGYQVTALNGDYVGSWIDFFRDIADAGKDFVIRENEVLVKVKSFIENLSVDDSLTVDTNAYETRIGYADVSFSQIDANMNLVTYTTTEADFVATRNPIGDTYNTLDILDSYYTSWVDVHATYNSIDDIPGKQGYGSVNVAGATTTIVSGYPSINAHGITASGDEIAGADWVWVEGVSDPYI